MLIFAKLFTILILLLLIDSIYLFTINNAFSKQIELVQNSPLSLNMIATGLCYISLTLGIYYFILKDNKSIFDAFLLGVMVYSVYDMTTLALLKDWQWSLAIIDSIWGGILFTVTSAIFYQIFSV